jgi:hypothetical protein
MNKLVYAVLLGALATPAFSQDVGVSISIGQPGFYGQINIGNIPRPPVIYSQPVLVERAPEYVAVEPIYLHVPPGHEKNWRRHCAEYHACGRPVYFVRDDWYNNEYVPHYKHEDGDHDGDHGRGHGHGHEHHEDHGRGHDHDD